MAIDTAEKRKSISGIWLGLPGVTPNSLQDEEWRQQSGWSYSGILAGTGIVVNVWVSEAAITDAWAAQVPVSAVWSGQIPIAPAWTPEPPL